jgi:hypothetical protein
MEASLSATPPDPAIPSEALDGSRTPDVVGAVEVVTAGRIAGWALDRAAADRRLEVEIRAAGAPVGRVTAERPRHDLARTGPGDGCHGFELRCPEPLCPHQLARIEAFAVIGADEAAWTPLPVWRPDGSFPSRPRAAPPPPWVAELATLCRTIERHARRLEQEPAPAAAAPTVPGPSETGELRELVAGLIGRIESLDALHPRLDGLAARLDDLAHATGTCGRPQRGLAWAVALTAGLALASLGTGVAGYWF